MNVVDLHPLHPEDLIDKLVAGALTGDERERLQAHLRDCTECRFELSVRGDFADEALVARPRAAVPAGPLLSPSERPSADPSAEPLRSGGPRSRRPARRALLLPIVAAALVAGGSLAAVVSEVVRTRHAEGMARLERPTDSELATGDEKSLRPRTNAVGSAPGTMPASVAAPSVDVPATEPGGPALAGANASAGSVEKALGGPSREANDVRATSPSKRVVANRRALPTTSATDTADRGTSSASFPRRTDTPSPSPEEATPRTAAGVFGAANRARRYGDTVQAMALYRTLQGEFPTSEEARLSRATLATLQLDRGDPKAALDGFDQYLAQGGSALGVEALVGRALALGKLGQASAELAAWRDVARRFPGTVHARRAAARIAVLSAR